MSEQVLDDSPTTLPPGESGSPAANPPRSIFRGEPGAWRQVSEFLILLVAGILVLRYFVAEAYVVPTGSMAPTILGFHSELDCPNCQDRFSVGIDEEGLPAGRPVCPNCGHDGFDPALGIEASGDRLLVQKFLFDFRRPRRWEVAVFQSPIEPAQAYVKRVVGLPGEAVLIVHGDVWIDGKIARKSIEEVRAMKIPVFDNRYQAKDAARFPRWAFRGDRSKRFSATGWRASEANFVHEATSPSDSGEDWLEYQHWDPDRSQYGPIRDSYPYNGGGRHGSHVVRDLVFECKLTVRDDVESVQVRVVHGADTFLISLPVDEKGSVEVRRNRRFLDLSRASGGLRPSPSTNPKWDSVEVAVVDRRVSATLNGVPLFDPIDYEASGVPALSTAGPVALGVVNGSLEVKDLRLFRDIYYTGELESGVRKPAGVNEPFKLRDEEYFVLGDNSPVSNDSRFWDDRPVVRQSQFLGKPFLVHLPGQAYGVRIFGRELGWIPDFREIRYIR